MAVMGQGGSRGRITADARWDDMRERSPHVHRGAGGLTRVERMQIRAWQDLQLFVVTEVSHADGTLSGQILPPD